MITIKVPGSKSITNRALICAALARGNSKLYGALESDDTHHMISALKSLGVSVKKLGEKQGGVFSVRGGALKPARKSIFCGNAGTALRFLSAVLATQNFRSKITGNSRMQKRPAKDLADALRQLGAAVIFSKKSGFPPLEIKGPIPGGKCALKGNVSSQFLSGLLLAAPLAEGGVKIQIPGKLVSRPYVDMTISVMAAFGVKVKRNGYKNFFIAPGQSYKTADYTVEGDASSASYFWGISAISNEPVKISNVPRETLQADARFVEAVKKIPGKLNCSDFPDSAMTLAVCAAFKKGITELRGLENLRVKESDRLRALVRELGKIGCRAVELKDGLRIYGDPGRLHGARIKTYNDHRMAMCFGMAKFFIPEITIENPLCASKTYPDFWKNISALKKIFKQKNIILTGMRGSGKSRLGGLLAKKIKRKFYDIDEIIERGSRMLISEIVKKYGWERFRKLEMKAVRKVAAVARGAVIATGGGTLICPENAKLLKNSGKIIFLRVSSKILSKRIKNSKKRPPLSGKSFISELPLILKKREKLYLRASGAVLDASEHTRNKKADLKKKILELSTICARQGLMDF